MASYLFGDNDIAAQRLGLLAEVYAPSSRAFVQDWAIRPPRVVVDLGCGLGYTTHLLADVLQGEQTVGLDHSERFITLAQKQQTARVAFYHHDITQVPFPVAPADVLFCRLLLTHVQEPQALIARWATQLRPQGLLLMEEVEWIRTNCPVFTTYLDMQRTLFAHQSNCLDVGPLLHALPAPSLLRRRSSRVRPIPVGLEQAARMFALNFRTWKQHPFMQAHYAPECLRQVEEGLQTRVTTSSGDLMIEWGFRQLVYERI